MTKNNEFLLQDEEYDYTKLEKWYVYRSLHSDESWGAILVDSQSALPNCDFLIKVCAVNEEEAITKAKVLYEKIHKNDNKKDNIKGFATAALTSITSAVCASKHQANYLSDNDALLIARTAMNIAIAMNDEYENFFLQLNEK